MRFSVCHETLYAYSVPVGLAPHLLRLDPRPEAGRLISRNLEVDPLPSAWIEEVDEHGNRITRVRFSGTASYLRVVSGFELETSPPPPIPYSAWLPSLPWLGAVEDGLAPYRWMACFDPAVDAFARDLAAQVSHAPLAFLDLLNATLHHRTDRRARFEGAAQAPGQTLASGRGACRDLAVLFLACCRCLGLAGRFVSGYQAPPGTPDGPAHLHAWPEVFLPGLGWRGWDPTLGAVAGDGHVALCAAPGQEGTMPVEGGFYANGVTATLDCWLRIGTS